MRPLSILKNLSLARKLSCVAVLFLFPLALMIFFLITEKDDLILFTKTEITGVNYLRPLKEAMTSLASGSSAQTSAAAAALKKAQAEDKDHIMDPARISSLIQSLESAGTESTIADAMEKTASLISGVSDASNITLDPDMDAYYVGDIIVNQLTGVVQHAVEVRRAASALASSAERDESRVTALALADAALASSAAGVMTDIGKAITGNKDGSVQERLSAKIKSIGDAAEKTAAAVKSRDMAAAIASTDTIIQSVDAVNTAIADEMEHLLNARNSGFVQVIVLRSGTALLFVLIGVLALVFVSRAVAGPLNALTKVIGEITAGNLDVTVGYTERRDEVGDIARATEVFRANGLEVRRMTAEQEQQRLIREERSVKIDALLRGFEGDVMGVVDIVGKSAHSMSGSAEALSSTADKTSHRATIVASAAVQATTNVQTVAAATEELSSSILEITRQVQDATSIAAAAAGEAKETNLSIEKLAENAEQIGAVISLINDIASQTNLLALNATIEAARAGEAGKGFAVVASEVKNLANQTAKATDEIAGKVQSIQAATNAAVGAIGRITATILQINKIQATIAAAVEEQSAATKEISRNVQEAAVGTADVSQNITQVTQDAESTGSAAMDIHQLSASLAKQSETLRAEVDRFITTVRAA